MRFRVHVFVALSVLALPAVAAAQRPPDPPRPPARVVVGQTREARDGREEQRETFTKTVRIGGSGVLDISNLSGSIEVRRGNGNDAVIEVTKIARGRTVEEAKEMLPLVTIDITSRGERADIKTIYPHRQPGQEGRDHRRVNVSVNYMVTAPQNTRVRLFTLSGNLKAVDIRGELSLETTSGNVWIENASRIATAKSKSGAVELTNVDSDGALDAGTFSGSVILKNVKARRIKAGCISGRIVVQDVETGQLDAQTISGDVTFSGVFAKAGRYDLKTNSGNVRAEVGGQTGFQLEANTFSGRVHSDFTVGGAQEPDGRGRARTSLSGTVGDGSATLNVTTFSGNVYVVKR